MNYRFHCTHVKTIIQYLWSKIGNKVGSTMPPKIYYYVPSNYIVVLNFPLLLSLTKLSWRLTNLIAGYWLPFGKTELCISAHAEYISIRYWAEISSSPHSKWCCQTGKHPLSPSHVLLTVSYNPYEW